MEVNLIYSRYAPVILPMNRKSGCFSKFHYSDLLARVTISLMQPSRHIDSMTLSPNLLGFSWMNICFICHATRITPGNTKKILVKLLICQPS